MSKLYLQHDYKVTGRDYVETDGGDTPGGGGVNYTFEEREVGVWTDGSKLYECCFSSGWSVAANTGTAVTQTLTITPSDIDKLIYYEMIPLSRSAANCAVQGIPSRINNFALVCAGDIILNASQVKFKDVRADSSITWVGFTDVIIKIRYTKTA